MTVSKTVGLGSSPNTLAISFGAVAPTGRPARQDKFPEKNFKTPLTNSAAFGIIRMFQGEDGKAREGVTHESP